MLTTCYYLSSKPVSGVIYNVERRRDEGGVKNLSFIVKTARDVGKVKKKPFTVLLFCVVVHL